MSRAARKLVCLGFGYCARALARTVAGEFREVVGTARRADRARALLTDGFAVLPFDAPGLLDGATHLLISAPPEAEGDPVLAALGDAIAGLSGIAWIGYLSTTGVYGDRRGDWVSEDDAPSPAERRSRSRLAAERAWLAFGDTQDAPVHIFRLAGIYGPGRNVLDRLRAGSARRIVKPGQVFSRVHVEDVAKVLQASIARPQTGRVYNIADDEPASQEEVVGAGRENHVGYGFGLQADPDGGPQRPLRGIGRTQVHEPSEPFQIPLRPLLRCVQRPKVEVGRLVGGVAGDVKHAMIKGQRPVVFVQERGDVGHRGQDR